MTGTTHGCRRKRLCQVSNSASAPVIVQTPSVFTSVCPIARLHSRGLATTALCRFHYSASLVSNLPPTPKKNTFALRYPLPTRDNTLAFSILQNLAPCNFRGQRCSPSLTSCLILPPAKLLRVLGFSSAKVEWASSMSRALRAPVLLRFSAYGTAKRQSPLTLVGLCPFKPFARKKLSHTEAILPPPTN